MAIIKAKITNNYVVIPNSSAQDLNLSFEARGVLALMLSMPDDWAMHRSWLMEQSANCGRDKIIRILKELEDNHYLVRSVRQSDGGRMDGWDWVVYPEPHNTDELENRSTENPLYGKPTPTKETVLQKKQNTKDQNTSCRNLKVSTSEFKKSKFVFTDDDMKLARWMFSRVLIINPTAKQPNFESWANDIRMMRVLDKHTLKEISALFDWANKDSFWCVNVLCPKKLRDKWGQLAAKAINPQIHTNVAGRQQNLSADCSEALRMIRDGEIF